ncbi:FUN34 transmembrane protein [Hysterangium stoloniferum]|nr:FUN34 transmembrane protein [Hysterangium stoloniferum]
MATTAHDVEKGNGGATFEASALTGRQGFAQGPSPSLRTIANPAPLGLFSFASTTLILSLFNLQARDITIPNVVVGMALGCGGLAQLLAGQWEFVCGNTFGATAFSSYGAFWLSFGALYWPGSGILDAYVLADGGVSPQLESALGIYLITWFIVTFLFFVASLRTHLAFNLLFGFLALTFALLSAGAFTGHEILNKVGGGFGVVTALVAYYTGGTSLINNKDSFANLPRGLYRRLD